MKVALWWVRRDLRLADNPALDMALRHGDAVIPAFILDPGLLSSRFVGPKRLAFLFHGLRELDADLRARGSQLVVRRGDPLGELCSLLGDSGAGGIYAEQDFSPYARRRDRRVADHLPLHLQGGPTVHPPEAIRTRAGGAYRVFTPFSRTWESLPQPGPADVIQAPAHIPSPTAIPRGVDLETLPTPRETPFRPGEAEALRLLRAFTRRKSGAIIRYAAERDRLDLEGTSRLSPYLRFGMLSARQAVAAARSIMEDVGGTAAGKGVESWMRQLIWREFFIGALYHFPEARTRGLRPDMAGLAWLNKEEDFAAWCEGQTGYPVVDAAMRQLHQTGWIHNRARMIAASFLVKDLLVDWRWGERWFMQHLVDGDPAANNGGWQWMAGTGTDAAPYFRVFNPVLQGQKYDPVGAFVRRWVPEMEHVDSRYIHRPWGMPEDVQRGAACMIGKDYPAPIVDHAWARERALAAYGQARAMSGGAE
jgi:deoxyribodipyrimidine photo-lyase